MVGGGAASEAARFLSVLWGDDRVQGRILIWSLKGKRSRWFEDAASAAAFVDGEVAAGRGADVYVGCSLAAEDLGPRARGEAATTAGAAGLWVDLDYAHPVHRKPNLPPTPEDAAGILAALPLRETVLVDSGHGFQAWWVFSEVLYFSGDRERAAFAEAVDGWQCLILSLCREKGWVIDKTHDLARVLRIPGTLNAKEGEGKERPCKLCHCDGPRYPSLEPFLELCAAPARQAGDNGTSLAGTREEKQRIAGSLTLTSTLSPPFEKFMTLLDLNPKFKRSWNRQRSDMKDQSASGYDQSLADFAVEAGWTDQEVVSLLITWRRTHGEDLKLDRADAYAGTIANARAMMTASGMLDVVAEESKREEKVEMTREDRIAKLAKILRLPLIDLVRHGDAAKALINFVLAGGREILIGDVSDLLSLDRVRSVLATFASRVLDPEMKRNSWLRVVDVLVLPALRIVEEDIGSTEHLVGGWIELLLSKDGVRDVDDLETGEEAAVWKSGVPFTRDGELHVALRSLMWRLAVSPEETKPSERHLTNALRGFGFGRKPMSMRIEGKVVSRNLWVLCEEKSKKLLSDLGYAEPVISTPV